MTSSSPGVRAFTVAAAIVAWAGVLLQLVLSVQLALGNGKSVVEGILIYLGFFTVLTNILVALALAAPLVRPASTWGRFFARPGVASAVAAAITVVGAAYFFLLRNVWNPQGLQLIADVVLHYVTPVLFLAYWWLAIPKEGVGWSGIARWALYPVGYLVYALVRGAMTGLYPYHFIDVAALGLGAAIVNATGVLMGFVVIAAILVAVARLSSAKPL